MRADMQGGRKQLSFPEPVKATGNTLGQAKQMCSPPVESPGANHQDISSAETPAPARVTALSVVAGPDLLQHQKVGELEQHRQLLAARNPVETMYLVKQWKPVTTGTLKGGVGRVQSTTCPTSKCLLCCQHATGIAQHWANCRQAYVWCYYCTLCKSQQKLAQEMVTHVLEHICNNHTLGRVRIREDDAFHADSMPNGSRNFVDPWSV